MPDAPNIFTVENIENRTQRVDVAFFNPIYHKMMKEIDRIRKAKGMMVDDLDYFLKKSSPTHLTGGATPRGAVYVEDGIRFLRVQNIRENEIALNNCVRIAPDVHEEDLKRSQLRPDDVLLTITGTYGLAAVVPKDIGDANINQHIVKMELDASRIEPQYLAYSLNSAICRSQMDRAVTGSSRPALDYRAIRSLRILCPTDMIEQKEVTAEITSLRVKAHDKLDEARNLANSDREYILDELEVNLPESPAINTFSVNPDALLGRIDAIAHDPQYQKLLDTLEKGKYRPQPLTKFAKLGHETITPSEDSPLERFKLVELEDIDGELGIVSRFRELHGIQLKGSKLKFRVGQLLVSRLRYYLRKVAVVDDNLTNSVGSNEFYTLNCERDVDSIFLKSVLRHELVILQAESKSTGSSRPRLTKNDMESLMIPDVPFPIQQKIGSKISNDLGRIRVLRTEARDLMSQAKMKLENFLSKRAP